MTRNGLGDSMPVCQRWQHSTQVFVDGKESYTPCATGFNDIAMLPGRFLFPNDSGFMGPLASYAVWALLAVIFLGGGRGR